MQIQVYHERERIGDFLGSVPALQTLAQTHDIKIKIHPDLNELFSFTGLIEGVHEHPDKIYTIDLDRAYATGWDHNLHMTQAYYKQLDLLVPENPVRPTLFYPQLKIPSFDVVVCPYSVSLSWGHLWPLEKWNALIKVHPDLTFLVLGSANDERLTAAKNLVPCYGKLWTTVCNALANARCVISVVSGLSHLTHAVGAPHILMVNQPAWAQNPDAQAQLTDYLINEIPLSVVADTLTAVIDGKTLGNIGKGNYIL